MSLFGWFVVIFITSIAVIFGAGWMLEHADAKHDRAELLGQLDQATANVQLPRAGYLPDPKWSTYAHQAFAGAADPAQQIIPWDLAGAAYVLGQQRADQDAVSREVEAIFAEVESNPERWQR